MLNSGLSQMGSSSSSYFSSSSSSSSSAGVLVQPWAGAKTTCETDGASPTEAPTLRVRPRSKSVRFCGLEFKQQTKLCLLSHRLLRSRPSWGGPGICNRETMHSKPRGDRRVKPPPLNATVWCGHESGPPPCGREMRGWRLANGRALNYIAKQYWASHLCEGKPCADRSTTRPQGPRCQA